MDCRCLLSLLDFFAAGGILMRPVTTGAVGVVSLLGRDFPHSGFDEGFGMSESEVEHVEGIQRVVGAFHSSAE